ncbi:MAG: hypothetical protein ACYTGQ_05895, partial [Planctomycetota bacterium]
MNWWASVGETWLRGGAVALLASWIGWNIARLLIHEARGRRRKAGLLLAAAPLMAPALLVGYAWSGFSLSLVRHPVLNEVLYGVLLVARLSVIGAMVYGLAPAPRLTRSGWWLAKMAGAGRGPGWRSYWLNGPGRLSVGAVACVWVLSFVE